RVPNLEEQMLLIVAALTGLATAWHTARTRGARAVVDASVAVGCAVLATWLLYWTLAFLLPLLLALASSTPPPRYYPSRSYQVTLYVLTLVVVAVIVSAVGLGVGALTGAVGWALSTLTRQAQRSPTPR